MDQDQKRKFYNPTQGYVGATIFDEDGKRRGIPVEPGGYVWLSEAEERATAEAPRLAEDNPFTKTWREVTEFGPNGEEKSAIEHKGMLVLSDEPPRHILSDRFTPSQAAAAAEAAAEAPAGADLPVEEEEETAGDVEEEREITGAPPIPTQPPVEGQPGPDEHVATPEAVALNDEHLAAKAAEAEGEEPVTVGDRPRGAEEIGVRREPAVV